jgi:methyl-accepting chemotaxis protein
MKMSIRFKLFAAFGVSLVMIAFLGIFAGVQMAGINERALDLGNHTIPSIATARRINYLIATYRGLQSQHILTTDAPTMTSIEKEMQAKEQEVDSALQGYAAFAIADDERAAFERIRSAWAGFVSRTHQELLPASRVNDLGKAVAIFYTDLQPIHADLSKNAEDLVTINMHQADAETEAAHEAYTSARTVIIVVVVVAFLISALIGFFLSSSITRNIGLLTAATAAIGAGDLTRRVELRSGDELGTLAASFNQMTISLHQMTTQVQQASNSIIAAAAEILAATSQQAASAAEQSSAITQTTTTIEEVKVIVDQTAQQAHQVAQDSQKALTVARQGSSAVEDTVNGMGQIRTRVESIAQTILMLSEQAQAISSIITTVSELADQSNLLALNAAIEAARAGEQGKSFAVVAQHVRDLAERSKGATVEVRDILSEIQKATNTAVLVTEEGTKGVEAGGKLASQAGQVIHLIAQEVESGAQANMQMAAAAQQQTAGMEQIGLAMGAIAQAMTQAMASTRQAERAAQDLHMLAQSLQQTVTTYRL